MVAVPRTGRRLKSLPSCIGPSRRAGFEKGWHCLTAGVRRLHMDVLDVVLVVYPESFVYNVIAQVVDTRKAVSTMTITPVIHR